MGGDDWKALITFWRGEEAKKRSQQGKENRSKQRVMHKAVSKSYARVSEEMHKENGYYPRRDELFVRTHTRTDGTPINDAAAKVIGDIEMAIDTNPELLEKTVEQGDILSHVLGREKNGYVRCIGIGPTPADLRIPGSQKLKSTKLQLAQEETKQAWLANEALKEQVDDIRHDTQLRIDALTEELSQIKNLIAGNLTSQVIPTERADSVGESVAAEEHIVYNVEQEEQIQREMMEAQEVFEKKKAAAELLKRKKEAAIREKKEADQLQQKKKQELEHLEKKEAALKQNKAAAALQEKKNQELELLENKEATLKQNKVAAALQQKKNQELEPSKKKEAALKQNKAAAALQQKKRNATVVTQPNYLQGKDVILYNVYQNHATPVAQATVLSTDRKKVVGGRELGAECCEVVINYIIKKDAILPHAIGNLTTMGQAQGRSITWLYKHMELDPRSKTTTPLEGA